MPLKDIWSVVSAIIVSVGGAGVIICAASSFLANRISDRLEMKYQQALDRELEKYKSQLESKRYITKAQFDREFEIYTRLSKTFFELKVRAHSVTIGDYYSYTDDRAAMIEIDNKYYSVFAKSLNEAQKALFENGAFIPEHIYSKYHQLFMEVQALFRNYDERAHAYAKGEIKLSDRVTQDDIDRYYTISNELEIINSSLREYLTTLSVAE